MVDSVRSHGIHETLPAQRLSTNASTVEATQVQVVFRGGGEKTSSSANAGMQGQCTVVDGGESASASTSALSDSIHRCILEWLGSTSRWNSFRDMDSLGTGEPYRQSGNEGSTDGLIAFQDQLIGQDLL